MWTSPHPLLTSSESCFRETNFPSTDGGSFLSLLPGDAAVSAFQIRLQAWARSRRPAAGQGGAGPGSPGLVRQGGYAALLLPPRLLLWEKERARAFHGD